MNNKLVLGIAVVLFLCAPISGVDSEFVVIVHGDEPLEEIDRQTLKRLYMTTSRYWSDGQRALPVDLPCDSPIRDSFSIYALGESVFAVQVGWMRILIAGRGELPIESPNSESVLAFVASTPGAIGYVASGTPLGTSVKPIRVTEL